MTRSRGKAELWGDGERGVRGGGGVGGKAFCGGTKKQLSKVEVGGWVDGGWYERIAVTVRLRRPCQLINEDTARAPGLLLY